PDHPGEEGSRYPTAPPITALCRRPRTPGSGSHDFGNRPAGGEPPPHEPGTGHQDPRASHLVLHREQGGSFRRDELAGTPASGATGLSALQPGGTSPSGHARRAPAGGPEPVKGQP